jgi:hypothetical protein
MNIIRGLKDIPMSSWHEGIYHGLNIDFNPMGDDFQILTGAIEEYISSDVQYISDEVVSIAMRLNDNLWRRLLLKSNDCARLVMDVYRQYPDVIKNIGDVNLLYTICKQRCGNLLGDILLIMVNLGLETRIKNKSEFNADLVKYADRLEPYTGHNPTIKNIIDIYYSRTTKRSIFYYKKIIERADDPLKFLYNGNRDMICIMTNEEIEENCFDRFQNTENFMEALTDYCFKNHKKIPSNHIYGNLALFKEYALPIVLYQKIEDAILVNACLRNSYEFAFACNIEYMNDKYITKRDIKRIIRALYNIQQTVGYMICPLIYYAYLRTGNFNILKKLANVTQLNMDVIIDRLFNFHYMFIKDENLHMVKLLHNMTNCNISVHYNILKYMSKEWIYSNIGSIINRSFVIPLTAEKLDMLLGINEETVDILPSLIKLIIHHIRG